MAIPIMPATKMEAIAMNLRVKAPLLSRQVASSLEDWQLMLEAEADIEWRKDSVLLKSPELVPKSPTNNKSK